MELSPRITVIFAILLAVTGVFLSPAHALPPAFDGFQQGEHDLATGTTTLHIKIKGGPPNSTVYLRWELEGDIVEGQLVFTDENGNATATWVVQTPNNPCGKNDCLKLYLAAGGDPVGTQDGCWEARFLQSDGCGRCSCPSAVGDARWGSIKALYR